jgi:hypothetical protein
VGEAIRFCLPLINQRPLRVGGYLEQVHDGKPKIGDVSFMLPGGPFVPFDPAISFRPNVQDSFSRSCFLMASTSKAGKSPLFSGA